MQLQGSGRKIQRFSSISDQNVPKSINIQISTRSSLRNGPSYGNFKSKFSDSYYANSNPFIVLSSKYIHFSAFINNLSPSSHSQTFRRRIRQSWLVPRKAHISAFQGSGFKQKKVSSHRRNKYMKKGGSLKKQLLRFSDG